MAPLRVGVIAGEASGSALGAGLVRELRRCRPDLHCFGVGGADMAAAGCEIWHDAAELSVMGLTEVLRHLPRLLLLRRRLRRRMLAARPDVFLGVDLPDFNLGVARWLRKRGIATMQYVSPSVWAWRERRVHAIARAVDEVLCLLPFEPPFYAGHGVAATFVGHPLADRWQPPRPAGPARERLGLDRNATVVAVLPGSRAGEVEALGDIFAAAVATLHAQRPSLVFVVPCASAALRAGIAARFAQRAPAADVRLLDGQSQAALEAADVALLASGTATLETMLIGRPMVVAYRLSAGTHWLLRRFSLLRVSRFSLPNLLADADLVPELMQEQATPAALAAAVGRQLDDAAGAERLVARFAELATQLRGDADASAARAVLARVAAAS